MSEPKDGVHFGVPFTEYQSWRAINQSSIRHGRKSMRAMRHAMTVPTKATPAMALGRAIHSAILEPELFGKIPVFEGKRTAKVGLAKFEDRFGECITEGERDKAIAARDLVMDQPEAAHLINESRHEVSLIWTDPKGAYGRAKIRLDFLGATGFGDLKTSKDISLAAMNAELFSKHKLQYIFQFGWAIEGLSALKGGTCSLDGYLIAVQTVGVPDAYAGPVDRDGIEWGRTQAVEIAKRYKAAEVAGVFHGAADGDIPTFYMPDYLKDGFDPKENEGEAKNV